jgi:hypothetical protein
MSKYERPEYDVVLSESPFELREYKDFYIVEYSNDRDPDIQNGFGTLFRYISSDNLAHQKIKMTVPVIEEMAGDQMKMAFVVPKEHWDHIPEPNSRLLSVKKFDSGLFAVIKYGGFSNEVKERDMVKKLSAWLDEKKYKAASNFMLAFYNAPFTPPMLRHNEIMVRIER